MQPRRFSAVSAVSAQAYRIPTETTESDGTLEWGSTTIVVARVSAGGFTGTGYTYAHKSVVEIIKDPLADLLVDQDPFQHAAIWQRCSAALRNQGNSGLSAAAVSAVDLALWDLKGRLLETPVVHLLGQAHPRIKVYGSGGLTSMTDQQLEAQMAGYRNAGLGMAKMKVGRNPKRDPKRVAIAKGALGQGVQLMVDANGAYTRKQALELAQIFAEQNVIWLEEPVPMSDRAGLRLLRDSAPPGLQIASGEYAYLPADFRDLLQDGCVDVLQADATRCQGLTGFLQAAALANAFHLPLSSHCAPTLHVTACCAAPAACHLEYFQDHERIERLLLDGFQEPAEGHLQPDTSRPGLGFDFRESDAERYRV